MTPITLANALEQLDPSRACLLTSQQTLSVGQLLAAAYALRMRLNLLQGACIALRGLSPLELVTALVAIDGVASKMLLLPNALDSATVSLLIDRAECTHILEAGGGICTLVDRAKPSIDIVQTKWLIATSGTTGSPKIIEHTLATLSRTAKRDLQRGAEYRWGLLYDPCRFAGLQVVLQALLSGSKLALSDSTSFDKQVDVMLQHEVNALSATPTLWRKLLMDGRIVKLPLRQLSLGGEIADQAIIDALKMRFSTARVVHIYASTEAGTGFAVKDGRAGFPAAWLNDANNVPLLRIGPNGHLFIKPPMLPSGNAIAERMTADGYLDTEDLVEIKVDRVHFLGRASGAINVGGNKVNPEEIETYLKSIEGVVDARVFGKMNSMMGQLVATELVVAEQADTKLLRQRILQQCRKDLEAWQVPALVSFVKALKETAAGKRER